MAKKLIQMQDPDGNDFGLLLVSAGFSDQVLQAEWEKYWQEEKDGEDLDEFAERMIAEYSNEIESEEDDLGYTFERIYIEGFIQA